MPNKTHLERVEDEIIRQWPERVESRARLIRRPLGAEEVSDKKAEALYWQRNPNPAAILLEITNNPQITDWEITKLIYPNRDAVLQGIKNERGIKAMIAFERRMRTGGQETMSMPREEPANVY